MNWLVKTLLVAGIGGVALVAAAKLAEEFLEDDGDWDDSGVAPESATIPDASSYGNGQR